MLVQLLPDQVSEYWPLMRPHIVENLPPISDWGPYDINEILKSLLIGSMIGWLVTDEKQEEIYGFIVGTILADVTDVRTFIIYTAIALQNIDIGPWIDGVETIKKYALSKGCSKLGAFLMNQKLLDLLSQYDVDTRFTFAFLNI